METKKEIRKRILSVREHLPKEDWEKATESIARKVAALRAYREASAIYCYVDYRGEVGTQKIMEDAWVRGKTVAVPKVEGKIMQFYRIDNLRQLKPGAYGILEPEGAPGERQIPDETKKEVLIMPGSAFDLEGGRIGYGGGFYDKYMAQYPSLTAIAIAFDLQIVDHIPVEETDRRPDILITETRSIIYADGSEKEP